MLETGCWVLVQRYPKGQSEEAERAQQAGLLQCDLCGAALEVAPEDVAGAK